MAELEALEGVAVVGDGETVLAAAIDEFEYRFRQTALRGGAQVIDVRQRSSADIGCSLDFSPMTDDEGGEWDVKQRRGMTEPQ